MAKPTLTEAAQAEVASRPIIGGVGTDVARQSELNKELNLSNATAIEKARADLAAGKISPEEFNRIAGTHR